MKWYTQDLPQVMDGLSTTSQGLTASEADRRLQENGPNKLVEAKKVSIFSRFLSQLADPMILVLLAAALLSGITAVYADESLADVFIILFVVILNAVLGVIQESKAEQAIEALKEMSAATSKVLRDGHVVSLHSDNLVVGDVVILEAGDAVPADARLLECASLKVEEAALTGESEPVNKQMEALSAEGEVPLGDRKNMVYMGSTVVYGRGKAVITATGMDTEMGHIASALSAAEKEQTPLQQKLGQLSRILTWLVLGICVLIFAVGILREGKFTADALINTFMLAISLAVAAIPEGLAAVVTIVLSIGVTKMSKRNAVIRRLTAVETLGCTQIICSDKTGTLTQNKMTVVDHSTVDTNLLATAMALCSDAEPDESGNAVGEPTECALVNFATSIGLPKADLEAVTPRVDEAPFDSMRKMMSTVHQAGNQFVQYTKGAPDEVLRRCTRIHTVDGVRGMTDDDRKTILAQNKEMADRALRVLCAAYTTYTEKPTDNSPAALEKDLIYIGLTGMIDPIRPEVRDAVVKCHSAGVRVVMITGDHRDTAVAIAKDLGILTDPAQAITGTQLNELSDEELAANIQNFVVYARVQPEHKVRIVKAWQAQGKVTAMTGDGVNDAPSIKSADIGIGMGITGTDVTKNVADMILADDNFATIVSSVEEGRRIYSNIRKAIQFLLSTNLSEVISIFFATMLGFTILKPAHILWINLITDSLPALALGMEESEKDSMSHPPRDPKDGIFAGGVAVDIFIQGALVAALTVLAYFIGDFIEFGHWRIENSSDGVTMAFLTMSMAEIFQAFNVRSRRHSLFSLTRQNKFLWGAGIAAMLLTAGVIYIPFLRDAFGFQSISFKEYIIAFGLALAIIPLIEIYKLIRRLFDRKK
ncbi:MAG: cation-translocating P-type ATPase [Ruminococcaceae bacterium]|nr:cation-translocating P-type ATPase [Oscillospiraceae bacterium]